MAWVSKAALIRWFLTQLFILVVRTRSRTKRRTTAVTVVSWTGWYGEFALELCAYDPVHDFARRGVVYRGAGIKQALLQAPPTRLAHQRC